MARLVFSFKLVFLFCFFFDQNSVKSEELESTEVTLSFRISPLKQSRWIKKSIIPILSLKKIETSDSDSDASKQNLPESQLISTDQLDFISLKKGNVLLYSGEFDTEKFIQFLKSKVVMGKTTKEECLSIGVEEIQKRCLQLYGINLSSEEELTDTKRTICFAISNGKGSCAIGKEGNTTLSVIKEFWQLVQKNNLPASLKQEEDIRFTFRKNATVTFDGAFEQDESTQESTKILLKGKVDLDTMGFSYEDLKYILSVVGEIGYSESDLQQLRQTILAGKIFSIQLGSIPILFSGERSLYSVVKLLSREDFTQWNEQFFGEFSHSVDKKIELDFKKLPIQPWYKIGASLAITGLGIGAGLLTAGLIPYQKENPVYGKLQLAMVAQSVPLLMLGAFLSPPMIKGIIKREQYSYFNFTPKTKTAAIAFGIFSILTTSALTGLALGADRKDELSGALADVFLQASIVSSFATVAFLVHAM